MVQLSHLDMTAGKTIALTIQTLVGKVMFLLFNTLSSFVIALTNCEIEINKIFVKVGLCELGWGRVSSPLSQTQGRSDRVLRG